MTSLVSSNYKDENFFGPEKYFFYICGLWRPECYRRWMEPYFIICRFNVFLFLGWGSIISLVMGAYLMILNGEVDRGVDFFTFSLGFATMQYKIANLMLAEKKIKKYLKTLEDISKLYPDKANIKRSFLIFRYIFYIGLFMMIFTVICYWISVFFLGRYIPVDHLIIFGINILESPYFEMFFLFQTVGCLTNTSISTAFDMFFCGILLTTSASFKNLNNGMRNELIYSNADRKYMDAALKRNLQIQRELLELISGIKDTFIISNMFHFLFNYTNVGLCLYQMSNIPFSSVRFWSMVGGAFGVFFTLTTYCEFAQSVTFEVAEFSKILYDCPWYNQSKNFKDRLRFAMMCNQKEFYFVAGNFLTLSRETLGTLMRAILTYYTFLRKTG